MKRKERTKKILEDELKALNAEGDVQKQIVAIIRCATRSLRFQSGKEAMDFILNSERTYQDLSRRILEMGESPDWYMNLVVREWLPILPELEFRGMVLGLM